MQIYNKKRKDLRLIPEDLVVFYKEPYLSFLLKQIVKFLSRRSQSRNLYLSAGLSFVCWEEELTGFVIGRQK